MAIFSRGSHCRRPLLGLMRTTQTKRWLRVLGIETSCDDTGIAIVTSSGRVISNVLDSQQTIHSRYGGIIPPRAQDLHRARIYNVFDRCMQGSGLQPEDLDAIAVTTKPGLPLSLQVGLRFAKHLARKYKKPIVPVHHMEAHALQARMEHSFPFPFLCLLISGGHSQLAFVRNTNQFLLLGETVDDAPGEAFDKVARRLRLYILPRYRDWNGGRIVEDAANEATNQVAYQFPLPLLQKRNCNFSFAGFKNAAFRMIKSAETKEALPPDGILTSYGDFCASLLRHSTRHLMQRTQRALEYCVESDLFGSDSRSLVISGGVANNDHIFGEMVYLAKHFNCTTFRPSKKYCSDNGVMIAWNGIEHILANANCFRWDYDNIEIESKATLGKSLIDDVEKRDIKCKWIQPQCR